MKIIRYKYKDPEKSWFNKIFKKKKSRWSSERFNGILKFVDSHIDYSKVMCIYMTPDLSQASLLSVPWSPRFISAE